MHRPELLYLIAGALTLLIAVPVSPALGLQALLLEPRRYWLIDTWQRPTVTTRGGDIVSRNILPEGQIHPAIRAVIRTHQTDIVREVEVAITENDVVIVGMAQNPYPKIARHALDALKLPYRYLEYGSYLSGWRRRNALKMWTGWPTFPMVFVKGQLVGGARDLQRLIASGEFELLLNQAAESDEQG